MNTDLLTALLLAFLASLLLYLSSKHQLWIKQRLKSPLLPWVIGVLFVSSLLVLTSSMQLIAAVFTLIMWVTVLVIVFPYLGAMNAIRKR